MTGTRWNLRGNSWPESDKETLRRTWMIQTASEIGKRLGRTRNAVIGMVNRMGLPTKATRARPDIKLKETRKPIRKPTKKPTVLPLPQGTGIPLLAVGEAQCRYILDMHGDPRGLAICCGKPIIREGSSWCDYHYNRNTDRRLR